MSSYANQEKREKARNLLDGLSQEEKERLAKRYRAASQKRCNRRSLILFIISIIMCIIPVLIPEGAFPLSSPVPIAVTVISFIIAFVLVVAAIINFTRHSAQINEMTDEEAEIRGAIDLIEVSTAVVSAFSEMGEMLSNEGADSDREGSLAKEYIARRAAEKAKEENDTSAGEDII